MWIISFVQVALYSYISKDCSVSNIDLIKQFAPFRRSLLGEQHFLTINEL